MTLAPGASWRRATLVVCTVAVLGFLPGNAAARRHRGPGRPPPARAGKFDYYVLSLSWSPEHCAEVPGPSDDSQCGIGRHYAFVVHGLWPQYERGGYPQSCATQAELTNEVLRKTLDVIPSETLIRHEWQKHGACSGLSAESYFEHVRRAFGAVSVPADYAHPASAFSVTAASVRGAFRTANAAIPPDGIAVACNGRFLTEVRLCLTKDDLALRPCGSDVHDNCRGEVTVRPVR